MMKRSKIELSITTQILLVLLALLTLAVLFVGPILNAVCPGWQSDGLFVLLIFVVLTEFSMMFT